MNDNPLGLLEHYGPHIFAACIILYTVFYTYLAKEYENEEDDEN
jgi:hypothetical protein